MPYTETYNDSRFRMKPGFASPRDFRDTLIYGLAELLREGGKRRTMMTAVFNARWSGQAGRAAVLVHFLVYALSRPGIRFMRRADIAQWWLDHYPPQ